MVTDRQGHISRLEGPKRGGWNGGPSVSSDGIEVRPQARPSSPPLHSRCGADPKSEGMAHILLVDDDTQLVSGNVAALEAIGHTVASASTSSEATQSIGQQRPDLVVLEGMLDGAYGGIDLARSLAHDFPTLPLIMLTRADDHFTPKERSAQDRDGWLPVQRYLEKPVSTAVLLYEVDHLLPGAH